MGMCHHAWLGFYFEVTPDKLFKNKRILNPTHMEGGDGHQSLNSSGLIATFQPSAFCCKRSLGFRLLTFTIPCHFSLPIICGKATHMCTRFFFPFHFVYVAQASLKLSLQLRMTLNSWASCTHCAGITMEYHLTCLNPSFNDWKKYSAL